MAKKNIMTNARDLRKFTRKQQIVTNTRQNIHAIGSRQTRSVGSMSSIRTGPYVTSVPGTGGGDGNVMMPCPDGTTPCGTIWSGDQPGMGSQRTRCCSMMDNSIGRDK